MTELFAVAKLLGSLANNINRLATVANSTRELRPDLEPTLAAVRKVNERARNVLHEFAGMR